MGFVASGNRGQRGGAKMDKICLSSFIHVTRFLNISICRVFFNFKRDRSQISLFHVSVVTIKVFLRYSSSSLKLNNLFYCHFYLIVVVLRLFLKLLQKMDSNLQWVEQNLQKQVT